MRPPLPGMDPWLEHPALWPDVHNRFIAAIADSMTPVIRPKYYIGLETRTRLLAPDELAVVGIPDLSVATRHRPSPLPPLAPDRAWAEPEPGVSVLEVELPMAEEIRETYLEVREVATGTLVSLIEVLSPVNKIWGTGRQIYERKRSRILASMTGLVEIDLLRAGKPLPYGFGPTPESDYRILVSRGFRRPLAQLTTFGVRNPIPIVSLPLLPEDPEPPMDLGKILHDLYDRAGYDLRLDYRKPPVPPLDEASAAWAEALMGG